MRLFEAILEANHRALAGDQSAGVRPADYAEELPVIALTCVDPRLNRLLPQVLGLPGEHFIWLRNAGNIITGPLSSTMRSLALACAVKEGREIAVIGHTDCQVAKSTTADLIERFKALGIGRDQLPANLTEFFGTFGSEQANVIRAVDFIRRSPIISPRMPVHGLLVDTETGRVEWLVNGYEQLPVQPLPEGPVTVGQPLEGFKAAGDFTIGELKFPEMKIGEIGVNLPEARPAQPAPVSSQPPQPPPVLAAGKPKMPIPPPYRPRIQLRKKGK